MSESPLLVERRGKTLLMTLNRPEVLNAQDQPMRDALVDALDLLDEDDELAVGILRGAGRAFSAGADMKEPRPEGRRPPQAENPQYRHFARLDRAKKPLIAVLHGHAVGGASRSPCAATSGWRPRTRGSGRRSPARTVACPASRSTGWCT
jgi:enoyl-CoA hydratase/carnithine racemase